MKKDKIYTQNYYNLKRNAEEDNFINELNKTDIVDLVLPTLKSLVDKLYNQITGTDKIKTALPLVITNETEINEKLNKSLSKHKLYKNIHDVNITSNFFTNALVKLDSKLFGKNGINDEKHFLQSYLFYWLENNLAKVLVSDDRFKSYECIRKVLDQTEILHHFYNSLKDSIPDNWINSEKDDWTSVSGDPKNVLESIRTFDKDYFKGYESELKKYHDYSVWKFIYESTRYSDHAMFSDEYSLKNSILLEKNIPLWIKFWDKLKLPILQDIPFLYNESPSDILNIAKELVKQKDSLSTNPKNLTFILLKNLFDSSLKVKENLSFYANADRILALSEYERNDEILKSGAELNLLWENENKSIYKETIETLLEIISVEEMSEWVFSYSPRGSVRGEYDTSYNKEIETLQAAFNPHIIKENFETQIQNIDENFNLRKFDSLAAQINVETNTAYAETLLTSLTKYIRTENFYWDGSFSPAYWPSLQAIGRLLSLTSDPVSTSRKLIQKFRVIHEGWNIAAIDYRLMQNESFVYCGAVLLLEHENAFKTQETRNVYFNYILTLIISQSRFTISNVNNDYTLPLYLLCLIANQIYPVLKESYEGHIINDLDSINTVVAILSNDNYKLSSGSETLLKIRVDNEFNLQKRQFMQRGQSAEIEKLEAGIKKLDISFN